MDWNKLQHTLFEMDPTDPREDLAKLQGQAQGSANAPAQESVDYLQESAQVAEGSLQMDRDYSVSDFAALAGVKVDEGFVDDVVSAYKAGKANYNTLDAIKAGSDAMGGGKAEPVSKDTKEKPSKSSSVSIADLSKGDSFKDSKGMVWYYNPNEKNWRSKDKKQTLSVARGFKMWQQSPSNRKRSVQEDQIQALESRVAYLESVIETLLEGKQQTGSAGQAKGKDPMPKAKAGRTKHPLKDKLVGESEQQSIKDQLWARLNELGKS